VAAVKSGGAGSHLAAYVVPAVDTGAQLPDLREWAAERLPRYMVPNRVVSLAELPTTPNGKVDRNALPDMPVTAHSAAARAMTRHERQLCGIVAELLGIERVSVEDDFFELGGHSVLAARLASRVRTEMGAELPLRAVFETPTVARLARRLVHEAPATTPLAS